MRQSSILISELMYLLVKMEQLFIAFLHLVDLKIDWGQDVKGASSLLHSFALCQSVS